MSLLEIMKDLTPAEFKLVFLISMRSYADEEGFITLSIAEFSYETGLDRVRVSKTLETLVVKGFIEKRISISNRGVWGKSSYRFTLKF